MHESIEYLPGVSGRSPLQAWLHRWEGWGFFSTVFPEKGCRVFLSVPISRVETVIRLSAYRSRALTPTRVSHLTSEKLVTQMRRVPSHESTEAWRSPESLGGAVLQLYGGEYLASSTLDFRLFRYLLMAVILEKVINISSHL